MFADATLETCREYCAAICINLYDDLKDQLSERNFYDLDQNNPLGTKIIGEYLAVKISQALDAMDHAE